MKAVETYCIIRALTQCIKINKTILISMKQYYLKLLQKTKEP